MGANRTPIDKTMTIKKAISQGGYYNTDGDWNNVMTFDEYPGKLFRGRVEVLILKDGKLFMFLKDNNNYRIPGGGFDKGVLNTDQAFIETKEEAKLIIGNIRFTGVTYIHIYDTIWKTKDNEIPYDGTYNEVYIADYKADYDGYVRKGLSDMELTNKGKFYEISEVESILYEPHKQALMNMFNNVVKESSEDNLLLTSQYFQNTIKELHKNGKFNCIDTVNINATNEGYVFAQYNTNNIDDIKRVKQFVTWCNETARNNVYNGYVEEPQSYNGYGYLYLKDTKRVYDYLISENCLDQDSIDFFTEAAKEMKNDKYPVFIVNSHIGTTFGKVISVFTRSEYAHSSIGLDSSLENMFSFNKEGFVRESISWFKQFNENGHLQVNCIFVRKNDLEKIRERLEYLWSNKDKTKYSLENILNIVFHRPMETARDATSMVCSQFVTWVLSFADIRLLDKSINLITPKDLASIQSPKIYRLYEGTVGGYDKKKIDRIFRKLKEKAELVK